jgi:hypothetical protein
MTPRQTLHGRLPRGKGTASKAVTRDVDLIYRAIRSKARSPND